MDFAFSLLGAALVLSVMGLLFTLALPGIDGWSKRFFRYYFVFFLLSCLLSLADWLLFGRGVARAAVYGILILECLSLSLPLPMLAVYLLHRCGESRRRSRLFCAVLILWAIYIAVLGSSAWIGIFSYDASVNYYARAGLYPLLLLPLIAILLLTFAGVLRRRALLSRKVFISFLIAILPMTLTLSVQLFFDILPLVDISIVISALSMYGFLLSDQIEQDRRRQQEIADQRANIMVLQMRPHFIYNTMTSIYYLCDQDPQLAKKVVMDFTTYLRKNLSAIASSTPIPFSSELEHTRAYLSVEEAVYKDSLLVDYDTPHSFFRIPPLTLQPIVENAVKHGKDPYLGPFHISIRTRKTETGSEIVVADNGRGFFPADDSELGIALENIRQRLEIMCGGSLTITPNEGRGTVVTVTIPDVPVP